MAFKVLFKFTKRQLLTLLVFSIADFCNAICVSLQAPFYPKEAEKKGASATEYGLVFGIFELVVFVISPIYGQHLNRLGPKYLFNGGMYTVGTCAILFGFLDQIEGHLPFITLSFIIRIIEAMGNAAFLTASFAIIAKEFPEHIATTFAALETFFGLGLIVGPTVGGALYEIGGYTTPFAVLGSMLLLSAIITMFVLPEHSQHEYEHNGGSLFRVLQVPGVFLAASTIVVTSMSIGFLSATLEPHLRQFELGGTVLGLMFVINGGTYAITAPLWGWICDKKGTPKISSVIGCILLIAGFMMIGPAPFITDKTSLKLTIIGLMIHGFGIAALLVSSFVDALRTAIGSGFANNLETYGLISGLWTSTFALGAFIGPSMAGILYDTCGFPMASMSIVVLGSVIGITVIIFIILSKPPTSSYKEIGKSTENFIIASTYTPPSCNIPGTGGAPDSTSGKRYRNTSTVSLPCERPPGMSGIISCNSYKNRHGDWHRRDSNALVDSQCSLSFTSNDPLRTKYNAFP